MKAPLARQWWSRVLFRLLLARWRWFATRPATNHSPPLGCQSLSVSRKAIRVRQRSGFDFHWCGFRWYSPPQCTAYLRLVVDIYIYIFCVNPAFFIFCGCGRGQLFAGKIQVTINNCGFMSIRIRYQYYTHERGVKIAVEC